MDMNILKSYIYLTEVFKLYSEELWRMQAGDKDGVKCVWTKSTVAKEVWISLLYGKSIIFSNEIKWDFFFTSEFLLEPNYTITLHDLLRGDQNLAVAWQPWPAFRLLSYFREGWRFIERTENFLWTESLECCALLRPSMRSSGSCLHLHLQGFPGNHF